MALNPHESSTPKSATSSSGASSSGGPSTAGKPRRGAGRKLLRVFLALVVVLVLAAGTFYLVRIGPVMFSEPYKLAVEEAQQSQMLKEKLGEPLAAGWLPQGNVDKDAGEARLNFTVKGSKPGKADVMVDRPTDRRQVGFLAIRCDAVRRHRRTKGSG